MSNCALSLKVRALAELELRRRRRELGHVTNFDDWLYQVTPNFSWGWRHLIYIREQLARLTAGEIRKLMLFLPPRHGKSEQVTVRYPAWFLEHNPAKRVIIGAYSQTLANKFSRKVRRIARERVAISQERTAVDDWETEAGGGLRAVGVGGGITGMGADLIIIDDPVKNREEANSETYRDKVWDWFTDDLYTRQEPDAAIILIMTRWHQDDLAGRILASEDAPNWTIINLPAEAELNDPLGRAEGEPLCPERYDVQALAEIRRVMGASYQALFQQRPSAEEGEIFKREYWRFYREPPAFQLVVQSLDTAFKTKKLNDYSVIQTWGITNTGFYLIDRWAGKVEFPELKQIVLSKAAQYCPNEILIEDKASGQSLIQELRRGSNLPIIAVPVDSDKIARANASTPLLEAGRCYLPEGAAWLADYLDTLAQFPNGAHDDDVDATTQFLTRHGFRPRRELLVA